MGKNTIGYDRYSAAVPRDERDPAQRFGRHPVTPDKYEVASKRAFDGRVRTWRRLLHAWDDSAEAAEASSTGTRGACGK